MKGFIDPRRPDTFTVHLNHKKEISDFPNEFIMGMRLIEDARKHPAVSGKWCREQLIIVDEKVVYRFSANGASPEYSTPQGPVCHLTIKE